LYHKKKENSGDITRKKKTILQAVSLQVMQGEIGILGENLTVIFVFDGSFNTLQPQKGQ
jgi:hypothetical protein